MDTWVTETSDGDDEDEDEDVRDCSILCWSFFVLSKNNLFFKIYKIYINF